jgi:hypothetical protein
MSEDLHGLWAVSVPSVGGDYHVLYTQLLERLGAFSSLTPIDSDGWEERVALAVHDATGMTWDRWDRLSPAARVPYLEKTLGISPDPIIEFCHVSYPRPITEPFPKAPEPTVEPIQTEPIGKPVEPIKPATPAATLPADEPKLPLDMAALGVFLNSPNLKKKQIAKLLKCHPKSLGPKRCPRLNAAIRAYRAPIDPDRRCVRGTKDPEDGTLEAWTVS